MRSAKRRPSPTSWLAWASALASGLMLVAPPAAAAERAAAPLRSAAPVELEDYVIKSGDTCVKIAIERYGDTRRIADIHAHNEMGPSPHHLKPGSILRLPRPGADRGPDARITFVRNRVEAFKPEPKPAEVNETLYRGHKVGTKEQASTELLFADTTRIQLGEQTLIVVLGGAGSQAKTEGGAETTLLTGALRARLGELAGTAPPKPALVRTDAAEVSLGPGEAQVQVDAKKATRLAVYKGRSSARAKRKTVEVPEGFGNKTELGQQPSEPKPLPPAPAWVVAPPSDLAVTDAGAIAAKYGAGTGAGPAAASWHVQVARDEAFNDLVVDARVPVAVTDLEAKGLTPAKLPRAGERHRRRRLRRALRRGGLHQGHVGAAAPAAPATQASGPAAARAAVAAAPTAAGELRAGWRCPRRPGAEPHAGGLVRPRGRARARPRVAGRRWLRG